MSDTEFFFKTSHLNKPLIPSSFKVSLCAGE